MPSIVVIAINILDYTLRKLDQGESEEGPLRVSGPVHIAGTGFLTTRTAGVQAARTSIGVGAASIGRNPSDTAATQSCQCLIGGHAVGSVNGVAAFSVDRILTGVAALRHDFCCIGIIEMPPLTGKRNQASIGAVALKPLCSL